MRTETSPAGSIKNSTTGSRFADCYRAMARAYPALPIVGSLKERPEDFVVEESLDFIFSGEGEHHYLCIEKSNLNTTDVAEKLAAYSKTPVRNVSYSGLKDKRALTTQWFSIHLPGKQLEELNWQGIENLDWRNGCVNLRNASLHSRKLRRGAHRANKFLIRLRNIEVIKEQGMPASLSEPLAKTIAGRANTITKHGFPNYFGEQRFGFAGSNLDKALIELNRKRKLSRNRKSLYLSAVRSFLFNQVVSARVAEQSWNEYQQNDRLVLDGSNSFFVPGDEVDSEIRNLITRLAQGDVHIGGLLPGGVSERSDKSGEPKPTVLEQHVYEKHPELMGLLDRHRLEATVRPFRAFPAQLTTALSGTTLELEFSLPSGSFATALLREFGRFDVNY